MRNRSLAKSRKLRFGTFAAAFTVFFIAALIVFNAIFSSLAAKFGWYIDMTEEAVFTLSEESKSYLADIKDEVKIYFASEPDELMADGSLRYVYNTANQLETEFPNIKVECRDVVKHPDFFEKFYVSKGTEITYDTVIVESGEESAIYKGLAFFTRNEEGKIWGYNGEYRFVSAIMQVTQSETPVAYFTTGHSEDVAGAEALADLLYDCGFDVRQIDLTKDEIDDDARILVIFNPKYDFHGVEVESEKANEINKIDSFLDGLGGLMVFEDAEYAKDLTNLNEFLEEWGISYRSDVQIKDRGNSMSVDGYSILTKYASSDTFGSTVYDDLENFDSMPKSIIRSAMPIEIKRDIIESMSGVRGVYSMLGTYDTAELIDRKTQDSVGTGEYDLVTISLENRVIDNDYYYSYVMAAGSPSFANADYLISNSYGNSDIIMSTLDFIGQDGILADLDVKPFDNTSSSATTEQAASLSVKLTLILPAIIAVVGVVVVIRRKHS